MSSAVFRLNKCATLFPQPLGIFEQLKLEVSQPVHLIAGVNELRMIATAERNGELVAKFKVDGAGLR